MNKGFCLMIIMASLLSGCERRMLEDVFGDKVDIRTDIDWLTRFGIEPTGMTFGIYNGDDGRRIDIDESNTVDRHAFTTQAGRYHLLIFNTTATELDMYDFRLDNYSNASVTLRQLTTRACRLGSRVTL